MSGHSARSRNLPRTFALKMILPHHGQTPSNILSKCSPFPFPSWLVGWVYSINIYGRLICRTGWSALSLSLSPMFNGGYRGRPIRGEYFKAPPPPPPYFFFDSAVPKEKRSSHHFIALRVWSRPILHSDRTSSSTCDEFHENMIFSRV